MRLFPSLLGLLRDGGGPRQGDAARAPRRAAALAACFVLAGLVAPHTAHAAAPMDEERDCLEAVPAAAGLRGVTDDGRRVYLDVRVLLDGVSLKRGRAVMGRAARAYSPLGIRLRASYDSQPLIGKDADWLITQAKDFYGGRVPGGYDLVYVLTKKNIELDDDPSVVGLADCIGGVRYRDRAFAVGENFAGENESIGPLRRFVYASAKTAGHEIGHLLGAHHHYANCAEGVPTELEHKEVSPCTLMFNFLNLISLNFGQIEGAVVRGHAVEFATP